MAFPSTDNVLCPTKGALKQTRRLCLAPGRPGDPTRAPCPPRRNLPRCQEEHLCEGGEPGLRFPHRRCSSSSSIGVSV
ncbi:unnamed protein product [Tetraodon nigroviridis]|uniref:(spotted green pufferfish) hypothetical protein n=1 Tax=Tetraodon nigroviridis TaxID=99883 RepID=Q4RKD7_TETNG|nr:unnamed protein product [Tetraodon nigroviridis]